MTPDLLALRADIDPELVARLRSWVEPHGWLLLVSENNGIYRAWMRHTGTGARMFGHWMFTAEESARTLEARVQPWVRQ